jgi:hypothetical protein
MYMQLFSPFTPRRGLLLRRAAVAMSLAAACTGAFGQGRLIVGPAAAVAASPGDTNPICANGTTWEEADIVTVHYPNEDVTLNVNRFDDALHVKITIGQEEREMIRMDNGLTAVRAKNDIGPRQFSGVDLLANSALHYLQQAFKTPCAASTASHFSLDVQDGPKSEASTVHLEGDMHLAGEALGYGMVVTEREGRSNATILKTFGSWDFADLGDIPEDTSIAGWHVYRNGNPVALEGADVMAVEDLKKMAASH